MDRDAAAQVVDKLFHSLYGLCVRYAVRVTGSLDFSEDIVQQAFMMLYRQLRQGETVENPRAWLFCVVRREITRHDHEEKRHGGPFEELVEVEGYEQPAAVPAGEPDDELGRLLRVLTRRELEVILLRLESLKYQEIGTRLGISTNTVKTLLTRGLRKLQKAAKRRSVEERFSGDERKPFGTTLQ